MKLRQEKNDKATLEVVFKPSVGISGCKEKHMAHFFKEILENIILLGHHPRSLITVVVQVLEDNGQILSASFNAIMISLINAAIPMKYVAFSTFCCITEENEMIINPKLNELTASKSSHLFCFNSITGDLVASKSSGSFQTNAV